MNKQKGFTLIELLVVIAIIGLLATLTVASLNSARSKSRDARRISDIKQVQTALELYLNDQGSYATPPAANACGTNGAGEVNGCCLSSGSGFASPCSGTEYMRVVPDDPTAGNTYVYAQAGADTATYQLTYELENPMTGVGASGAHTATPNNIANP